MNLTKITALFVLLTTFTVFVSAQNLPHFPKVTPAGKRIVNTKIDNIGYWELMARAGYVEVNPWRLVKKAVNRSSLIQIDGLPIQDSPDVAVVDGDGTTQTENSIFIDPEDENITLNSNNSSDWNGSFAANLYGCDRYWSFDAASVWGGSIFGVGQVNMGDPATAISRNGRWYVGKINNGRGQSVAYSTNQGQTWTDVLVSPAPTGFGDLLDKNHLWIDNSEDSPYEGYLYTAWSCYVDGSPNENQIEISRSADQGLTWSVPVGISHHINGINNQGVNIQTGPNGEVYATWIVYDNWPADETAIGFSKSLDGGVTWVPGNRILTDIKGIRASGTKKDMRVASFPCMTVDLSGGPNHGTLYVVWANIGVPGNNTGTDIDIYISSSTNLGDTWSDPIRVNQDPSGLGKNHFLPWLTCDPLNGNLCAIYYDDRDVDSTQVETWVSYSYDAGNSWTDFRVSDVAFTPSPIPGMAADYFGDYIGIKAQNMKVYPIWTDNRAGNALTYVSQFNLGPPPNQPYVSYYSHELKAIATGVIQDLNFGDSLYMNLGLKNIGDQPAENLISVLTTESPYIIITDSTETYGTMQPEEIKTIHNGYSFKVSDSIPDGLKVKFHASITNGDTSWMSQFSIDSHAPSLRILSLTILDATGGNNNGRLDPGESVEVRVNNVNRGDFAAPESYALLSCSSPFITLQADSVYLDTLHMGLSKTASFFLTVADEAPTGLGVVLAYQLHSQYHSKEMNFLETIGIIVEDWETGDFEKFPWYHFGANHWEITSSSPWEGIYCAKSPELDDYTSAILQVEYTAGVDDTLSFYRRVSSEPDFDFLHFYIDNILYGSWSGETPWDRVAYPVAAGTHSFRWVYVKDIYMAMGQDKAWIDYIEFPPPVLPDVTVGPNDTTCAGEPYHLTASASGYDSLKWSSSGDGTFSEASILNPIYSPGPQDIINGEAKLLLRAYVEYGSSISSMFLAILTGPIAFITVDPKDTLCSWQSGILSTESFPGATYLWSPGGSTTSSIEVDTAVSGGLGTTTFNVIVTGSSGCTSTDSIPVTFRDCTAIDDPSNRFHISASPNPSNGKFNLRIYAPHREIISWRLTSSSGLTLLEEQHISLHGTYLHHVNIRHLASGIYFLEVKRDTETITEKIILAK